MGWVFCMHACMEGTLDESLFNLIWYDGFLDIVVVWFESRDGAQIWMIGGHLLWYYFSGAMATACHFHSGFMSVQLHPSGNLILTENDGRYFHLWITTEIPTTGCTKYSRFCATIESKYIYSLRLVPHFLAWCTTSFGGLLGWYGCSKSCMSIEQWASIQWDLPFASVW